MMMMISVPMPMYKDVPSFRRFVTPELARSHP